MSAEKYNHHAVEAKFIKLWEENELYKWNPELKSSDKKKYILDAFAYPSGSGLHTGHALGYVATDISARFNRLLGNKVLYPIGWDSFGLPAENYAIKNGVHPKISTEESIHTFENQVRELGLSVDWSKEIATHTPEYYKFTQWWFAFLYKKGLAYKKEALVNWDPVDQTVLANEQVLPDGTAERSGAKVEQRLLSQWFFKITDYADRLLADLDKVDWPESTKQMQRNWIGKSVGAEVDFKVQDSDQIITVFTTRIDTIYSGTFLILAPEHQLIGQLTTPAQFSEVSEYQEKTKQKSDLQRTDLNKDKTGAFTGSYAINPANGFRMQIWISDFVLGNYGTGAVFADAHDDRDFEIAKKYGIPLQTSIKPIEGDDFKIRELIECFTGEGILYNSGQFNGLHSKDAKPAIIEYGQKEGWARAKVTYRLRDWLVSRQRYWGSPIPIVYKPNANGEIEEILVDESKFPILLPDDVQFKPTGQSPLVDHKNFHASAKEEFGQGVYRESDTLDTFVCSSWYFLRFTDPHNSSKMAAKENMNNWGPVDTYVIGAEHIVLHLLYSRFFTKVAFDEGLIDFDEPFLNMRHPGLVLGTDGRKMSKRWGNVINPSDVVKDLGADTLRLYVMFMAPFDQFKPWSEDTIKGVKRFLDRVWNATAFIQPDSALLQETKPWQEIETSLNQLIEKVASDIADFKFNTSVAKFMEFLNLVEKYGLISQSQFERFIIVFSPFTPFISEEIWQNIHGYKEFKAENSVHNQVWPELKPEFLVKNSVIVGVQVNGKVRSEVVISVDEGEAEVKAKVMQDEMVIKWLEGKEIKKFIYIPGKIVNVVV